MTDLRKAAEMALDAMLSEYSTGGENKYSPWDVIEALRQALAHTEIPMSPEHLPKYVVTNGVKPMEGGGGGGSQPEQTEWRKGFNDGYETAIEQFEFKALKEAENQEPVAWIYNGNLHIFDPTDWALEPKSVQPLYAAPVKQTPVAWRKKANGVWHYFDKSTPFPFDDCEPLYEKN